MDDNPLGEFLRARRERVDPATLGLRAMGVRRTPGLRREEVAAQAGISVEYLIRLERGRDRRPSPAVVSALAEVLQLDSDGAVHLAHLADLPGARTGNVVDEVAGIVRRLLDSWPTPEPRLMALVGELSVRSDHFARLWGEGEVQAKANGSKVIAHPELGVLELEWSTLEVAAAPGQFVVAYQAQEGTASVQSLDAMVARVARSS